MAADACPSRRWTAFTFAPARGQEHGVDAVTIIREQVEMRRAAYGWVDGHAPRFAPELDDE